MNNKPEPLELTHVHTHTRTERYKHRDTYTRTIWAMANKAHPIEYVKGEKALL